MDENAIVKHTLNGNTWYVVDRAPDMSNAEITAGLLRTAGIPVMLLREAAGTAIPVMFGLLGGVDVVVPEAYYAEALALLDQDDDTIGELPSGEDS
ncbi:MAG TPA: DUF2007 domain-containing protein [Aggregatilineaceae bacterium]|nr:DUF2007 domain-containing protein [Aggregatilineaceae bacterium]